MEDGRLADWLCTAALSSSGPPFPARPGPALGALSARLTLGLAQPRSSLATTTLTQAAPCLPVSAGARTLKVLLSFAVGGLLGDVFLHLLPEAWASRQKLGE